MESQPFQQSDLELLPALQPEGWQDIRPSFDFYTRSVFCHPLKIIVDNMIAGIGTTIVHNDVAWLAHIIVHKDFRNKGIGLFITNTLVQSLASGEVETIYLLATDLGAPVYARAGFEEESTYLFFRDIKIGINVEAVSQVATYHTKYRDQLGRLDRETSAEDRLFHLDEHLDTGFVYCEGNNLKGFYLPRFGDGLIIADDPVAGLALLKKHLRSSDKVVFPADNAVALYFISHYGLKPWSTGKRMRLGKKRLLKLHHIYNRIGGNLG